MTVVGSIIIPGRPVSLNAERAANRWQRAELTKGTREHAKVLWLNEVRAGRAPKQLDRMSVVVHVEAKDRRYRTDVGNVLPSVKAAVDGLVDSGLIPDDTDRHLVRLTFTPTQVTGRDALVLEVHDEGETL